jgi:hypothetical protein
MIRAIAVLEATSGPLVDTVTITFLDTSGNGIALVRILDSTFVEIPVEQPTDCPDEWVVELTIERRQRPLWVEGRACVTDEVTPLAANGPLLGLPDPDPCLPGPAGGIDCGVMSRDCVSTFAELETVYSGMLYRCERCPSLREQERLAREVAWAFLLLAAAFLLAASAVSSGGFWGFILAAFWFVAALIFRQISARNYDDAQRWAEQADECEAALEGLRRQYESLRPRTFGCCVECGEILLSPPC